MALFNSSDIDRTIAVETTFNTAPTSGSRFYLPVDSENGLFAAEATQLASSTKRPNRSGAGSRRGMVSVSNTLELSPFRDPVMDRLLEGALSGKFATGKLKAAQTDTSYTVWEQKSATSVNCVTGVLLNGLTLEANANEMASISFDARAARITDLTAAPSLTVTQVTDDAVEFAGEDVKSITIGGTSVNYSSLSLNVSINRTDRAVLGSNNGLAPGVNGGREGTLELSIYDSDELDLSAINGSKQEVSFEVHFGGRGYSFTFPAANGSIPVEELSDGSVLKNVTFTFGFDATEQTDIIVEHLNPTP